MVFNPWRIDIQGIRWARETNGFICSILSSSLTSNLSSSSSLLPLPWFKLPSGFNVYRESEQDWRTTNSSPSCYFFRNLKRGVMRRPFEQIVVGLRAVTSQRSLENEMGCSLHTAYIDWREKQQHKKKNHGLLIPLLISSWEESTDKRVMTHDYCNRIGLRQDCKGIHTCQWSLFLSLRSLYWRGHLSFLAFLDWTDGEAKQRISWDCKDKMQKNQALFLVTLPSALSERL